MKDIDPRSLIVRAADTYVHPLNPRSQVYGTALGSKVGLSRIGISHVTVPAGKESFAYHVHYGEEYDG